MKVGTDTEVAPELGAFFESPEYDPVIATLPVVVGATKVTEQVPDSSVQEEGVKAPPVAANETVPVGEAPVAVAVQLTDWPGAITEGAQAMETDEGLGVETAMMTALDAAKSPEASVT